jgi:hypothetical protein
VLKNLKKQVSSREDHLPKNLFALSRCRIAKDDDFGGMFSRSQMHINEQDEGALAV